jgi:hypothetical protein
MWKLYDYVDERDRNLIAEWTRKLEKVQRIKLNSKLDDLAKNGLDFLPGLVLKTEVEFIYKLKIQGNPKLRPMFCVGPVAGEKAFTLLIGAKEISWKFEPLGADIEAAIRRQKVIQNIQKRRKNHERIN